MTAIEAQRPCSRIAREGKLPSRQVDQEKGSMAVKRIVANVGGNSMASAKAFYCDVLDLKVVMDIGWIVTFAGEASALTQLSVLTEGGSGTPVPDISIEVDNLDEVHRRAIAAGFAIEYGPASEPWGVRRFYVRDPFGRLLNILTHEVLPDLRTR
jgi:catechol 2,3-dioxygenase-like lactoylglutathione lyase family enzyme